jgi:hypothetical protein
MWWWEEEFLKFCLDSFLVFITQIRQLKSKPNILVKFTFFFSFFTFYVTFIERWNQVKLKNVILIDGENKICLNEWNIEDEIVNEIFYTI